VTAPKKRLGARVPKRRPRGAGRVRQLPSGRWQARFTGPDGVLRSAPMTFDTKLDATTWLAAENVAVDRGLWSPSETVLTRRYTLKNYASEWLGQRTLKPRTRDLYRRLLEAQILPDLGEVPLDRLTPAIVRRWHSELPDSAPTQRAHAYALLRTICNTAVTDELLEANPCRISGAGTTKRIHAIRPATLEELETITAAMPERFQAMVLLGAWCALRFGELTELRRGDVDLEASVVRVERGVVRVDGEFIVGDPKSEAGRRTVRIPPHIIPALQSHLDRHVGTKRDALLFPARQGGHLAPSSLYKVFYVARDKAGRSDLRFHDLRHTGATLAAATGASLANLMARLGHSTNAAAMRYQHSSQDADAAIAEALSGFATAGVVTHTRQADRR
jgi:integrase